MWTMYWTSRRIYLNTSLVATMVLHVEKKALRRFWSYHVHRLPVVINGTKNILRSLHLPAWLDDQEVCHPSQSKATIIGPPARPRPPYDCTPGRCRGRQWAHHSTVHSHRSTFTMAIAYHTTISMPLPKCTLQLMVHCPSWTSAILAGSE
jgi:hypothetical protein